MIRSAGALWWQRPVAAPIAVAPDLKGGRGGYCNRIACSNGHAYWFNATNGKYYCESCARRFNEVSRRHGERPLCELRI